MGFVAQNDKRTQKHLFLDTNETLKYEFITISFLLQSDIITVKYYLVPFGVGGRVGFCPSTICLRVQVTSISITGRAGCRPGRSVR